jgi:hypothetical protein
LGVGSALAMKAVVRSKKANNARRIRQAFPDIGSAGNHCAAGRRSEPQGQGRCKALLAQNIAPTVRLINGQINIDIISGAA